jgi:hypothetical protein
MTIESFNSLNMEPDPAVGPLNPALDSAGLGEQSSPANPPTDQPTEHNPADIFKDLAALRKASVVTIKRRQVFPAIKIIDKPASNLHFRCNPDPEMQLEGRC